MDRPVNDVETASGFVTLVDIDIESHPKSPMRDRYASSIRPAANIDDNLTSVMLQTEDDREIRLGERVAVTITFLPGWFTLEEGRRYPLQNGRRRVGWLEVTNILTRRD